MKMVQRNSEEETEVRMELDSSIAIARFSRNIVVN